MISQKFYPFLLTLWTFLFAAHLSAQTVQEPEPSVAYLSGDGVFEVASYSDAPAVPQYKSATIYYPTNKEGSFGGVAIAPGFTEGQANMQWWGPRLASHGYAVLTLDTNDLRDMPNLRADALMAAIGVIRAENERDGSPLKGKIDSAKMAVMGHSMGGGGVLLAANENSAELKAAIPFTPWLPSGSFPEVQVPTLVFAGEIDRIAAADVHAWPHYQTLPASINRAYMEFKGGNHFVGNSPAGNDRLSPNIDVHQIMGRMAIAWLKLYVDQDERYRSFIFETLPKNEQAMFSRFEIEQ